METSRFEKFEEEFLYLMNLFFILIAFLATLLF